MPTLEQIQLRIAKLQAQAEVIAAKKASVVLNQIASLMRKHGLSIAQVETHIATHKPRGRPAKSTLNASTPGAPKKRGRPAKSGVAAAQKGKLPPKYRNPETGETWSGHARPPAWIKHVSDRSQYLIAGASASAASKSASRKGAARKASTKGAVAKRGARKTTANGAASKTVARKARRNAALKSAAAVEASA
ncbi:MAG TPA: H-NS family nucleoid-associated regulatory protein [Pararobbsia sp.]|nr:H-NS family nucleoid-associated regulatory protein [Pararobbsia sp.]